MRPININFSDNGIAWRDIHGRFIRGLSQEDNRSHVRGNRCSFTSLIAGRQSILCPSRHAGSRRRLLTGDRAVGCHCLSALGHPQIPQPPATLLSATTNTLPFWLTLRLTCVWGNIDLYIAIPSANFFVATIRDIGLPRHVYRKSFNVPKTVLSSSFSGTMGSILFIQNYIKMKMPNLTDIEKKTLNLPYSHNSVISVMVVHLV